MGPWGPSVQGPRWQLLIGRPVKSTTDNKKDRNKKNIFCKLKDASLHPKRV